MRNLRYKSGYFAKGLIVLLTGPLFACASASHQVDPGSKIVPERIYSAEASRPEGTIWPGDSSKNLFFQDTKARKVGDLVTVLVTETATSTQTATTATSKESGVSVGAGRLLGLPSHLGIGNFLGMGNQFDPNLDAKSSNSHKGSGTTTRNGTLTATISATIKEILPSGNYLIEGKRQVNINNEEQILILTGQVRPEDINFDNTISSKLIAEASISYSGQGVIADEQRVGWGIRLINWIWPF